MKKSDKIKEKIKNEIEDEKMIDLCQQLLEKVGEAIPSLNLHEVQSVERVKSQTEIEGKKVEVVTETKKDDFVEGVIDRSALKDLCSSLKTLKDVADGLSKTSREEKELKVKALRSEIGRSNEKHEVEITILGEQESWGK